MSPLILAKETRFINMNICLKSTIRRTALAVAIIFSSSLASVTAANAYHDNANDCEFKTVQRISSSNRMWHAEVFSEICEAGLSAVAELVVQVSAGNDRRNAEHIFSIQDSGSAISRPILSWTGPNTLQILTLPNRNTGIQRKPTFRGLSVIYVYKRLP